MSLQVDGQDRKLVEQRINERITEIDEKIEMISDECDQAFEKWKLQMISSEEMSQLNETFGNWLSVLECLGWQEYGGEVN